MIKLPTKTSYRAITAVVLAFSLVASPLPFFGETAEAYTQPGYNGRIAFRSYRDGNSEIYVMDADGSNQTRLTNAAGNDFNLVWSPDGSQIAFQSDRDGNWEIYVMDADGSNQTNLTNAAGADFNPVWSPDGSQIAFPSDRDGNREIYVMDADGFNQTNLTNAAGADSSPVWSPDGSQIAFESNRDGNYEIYVMDADGSNQTRLTNAAGNDYNPVWSPDGLQIAFRSYRDGNWEIYVMDADGSNQTRLTTTPDYDEAYPAFSPDGSTLSFNRYNLDWDHSTLVIANADGSNQIEHDYAAQGLQIIDSQPWSPDGKKLLLTGWHEPTWNTYDQYIVDADGTNLTQITNDGSSGYGHWLSIPNTPPVTTSDTLTVPYQTPALADVLANDTDEEMLSGANLNITVQPTNGTASIVDGKVRYVPNAGFQGADSLTYEICDSFLLDQKCATGVLNITVQAPTAPALGVGSVGGVGFSEAFSSYMTSNLRPTFSGTASPFAEIKVEIHSDPIVLTTTADGDGNWSVTPGFDLPSGEHMVYISATLNGLTTELGEFGLVVGALANTGMDLRLVVMLAFGAMLAGGVVVRRRGVLRTL